MRALMVSCVGVMSFLVAAPVRAQGNPLQFWVEGRYLQDQDKTRDHNVRTGPGSGVAAGVDFSRRFGMQVAVDWPAAHVERIEYAFQSFSGGMRRVETIENSAPSVSVFAGFHVLTTNRVRVTVLAGLARFQTPSRAHTLVEQLARDGSVVGREEYESRDNYPQKGLAFGADVPVRLVGGLLVVPSVHAVYVPLADYGRDGFLRPSVGLRWTF
jgi:Outer membrane protein beta-barrel domain